MNSFGRLFRLSIFGESHGTCVGITIDGCPAGMPLSTSDFIADIDRRRPGAKGTTARAESDVPAFLSGVFNGKTTGAPLTITFSNTDTRSADYAQQRALPRPGHADWVAHQKFGGNEDYRGGGHFSGRLTLSLVAAGVVAKKLLTATGINISASVTEVGGQQDTDKGLERAFSKNDTVGGIVSCTATGLPPGLGEPFFDAAESLLSHALFAIPAVRGVEFGTGFAAARMLGSEHNDALQDINGKTATNHSGGITGGITSGNELVFRIAIKPTSSTPQPQQTLNVEKGAMEELIVAGRHDRCIALRVPVIAEAMTAVTLTDLMMLEQRIPRIFN
jgi:chorismate synthase